MPGIINFVRMLTHLILILWCIIIPHGTHAFSAPPVISTRRVHTIPIGDQGSNDGNVNTPPPGSRVGFFWSSDEDDNDGTNTNIGIGSWIAASALILYDENNHTLYVDMFASNASIILSENEEEKGERSVNYKYVETKPTFIQSIILVIQRIFQSSFDNAKMKRNLSNIHVNTILAPNSTVLTPQILRTAATQSGLWEDCKDSESDHVVTTQTIKEYARSIQQWYNAHGYICHGVTGVTLDSEAQTAVLTVREPLVASTPVNITFVKKRVVDETDEIVVSYRGNHGSNLPGIDFEQDPTNNKKSDDNIPPVHLGNTTYIATTGRTSSKAIAKALQLQPHVPFRWNPNRWARILQCPRLFSRVLQVNPMTRDDGTVQLELVCEEPKHLNTFEYGLSKSLYSDSWEGELAFMHGNVLGGGETLDAKMRRGGWGHDRRVGKNASPSVNIKFRNDRFGLGWGYDVEAFDECLLADDYNEKETPLHRKGATVRWQNLIPISFLRCSWLSASVERTANCGGQHETIGSTALDVGPFVWDLPSWWIGGNWKGNAFTRMTVGTRLVDEEETDVNHMVLQGSGDYSPSFNFLPYSSVTVSMHHILPLSFRNTIVNSNRNNIEDKDRTSVISSSPHSIELALKQSIMTSTRHLPRHQANAAGSVMRVRGYPKSSLAWFNAKSIHSLLNCCMELRIPITIPMLRNNVKDIIQDGRVVVFSDWMVTSSCGSGCIRDTHHNRNEVNRSITGIRTDHKTSIGIGLRKSIQGIPLKYDVCLTGEKKIRAFFGLGADFSV